LLDFIKNHTLTCYEGLPGDGCGKCPACVLRRNGYEEFLEKKIKK
jgi:7-cyano-7-deazaguanine synthase